MRRILFATAFVVTFIAGCVAATVGATSTDAQAAQPAPGDRECFAVSVWTIQGRALNAGETPNKTVRVPAQYDIVGGGPYGGSGEGLLLLCTKSAAPAPAVAAPAAAAPAAAPPAQ